VFHFGLGETTGAVWFDDVRLQEGSRQVWRRDYEGGLALANATATTQTISLGATYQKIDGTQVPEVNDGSLVGQVTLRPLDGLSLLRPPAERLYLPLVFRESSARLLRPAQRTSAAKLAAGRRRR
jgi:hypothetical protein